jgi:hypothetical protein
MYIYQLSRIHNRGLISAYSGLDKRECECLEYLLFIFFHGCEKNSGLFERKKERKYIYLTAHLSKYIKKRNDNTK